MKYKDALTAAMSWLGGHSDTLFIGQSVECLGTAMYGTLMNVPVAQRRELPVCEEMQMGMSIGLALNGFCPISLYPRYNFALLAVNQLVNHLDKLPEMSNGEFWPKAIIRTSIGSERPLDPQSQHRGDFTDAFRLILKNVDIVRLDEPEQIVPAYISAYKSKKSTILVEWGDYYGEK